MKLCTTKEYGVQYRRIQCPMSTLYPEVRCPRYTIHEVRCTKHTEIDLLGVDRIRSPAPPSAIDEFLHRLTEFVEGSELGGPLRNR